MRAPRTIARVRNRKPTLMPSKPTSLAFGSFYDEVSVRIAAISAEAAAGAFDDAIILLADAIRRGGVLQAFGTGHSGAFAMEIAGRAGGLIPTNRIRLEDLALFGSMNANKVSSAELERDPVLVDELMSIYPFHPHDVFLIASNSGVNGSIVGTALKAQELGHQVIGVTSLEHTAGVTPKHPSGKRLSEIADIVIDNHAPYGDTTVKLRDDVKIGAVSSITAAMIAQYLTIGVTAELAADGSTPPVYISANIPEGDEHNSALEDRYGNRIKRGAPPPHNTNERLAE